MFVKRLISISAFAAVAACPSLSRAEVTLDQLLGTVNVNGSLPCASIDIKLNRAAKVTRSFPISSGTDFDIRLEPLVTNLPNDDAKGEMKEAASVAPGNAANLAAVVFDPASTNGPVIHVAFTKPMAFKIVSDGDSRHVRVDVSSAAEAEKCLGKAVSFDENAAPSDAPAAAVNDASGALKEGKKQLAAGEFPRATAYFTKAVTIGSGQVKQDAQEMLGLSRERAGQLAFARAEYETYLKQYPSGANAARVKERLNGVTAAVENAATKQFEQHKLQKSAETSPKSNLQGKGDVNAGLPADANGVLITSKGMKSNLREAAPDPKAWVWEKHGSIAQSYYRNDNFTPSISGSSSLDEHRIDQNNIFSSGDFYLRGANEDYAFESSIALSHDKGFGDQSNINNKNFSTAYIDYKMKQQRISTRVGRQSKSSGGVLGRFDGGVVGFEPAEGYKVQVVGGSPVYSRDALPFADQRYFYGASLDYTLPSKEWAGTIYAIEQDVQGIVDRRALGAELRYLGKTVSVYSAVDYDIFYNQFNNAYLSGNWNPQEGTSFYATANFTRVPFLFTSNALSVDSSYTSLKSLVDAVGEDTANEWAGDRKAYSENLTLGGSQQLNETWQIAFDASLTNTGGTGAAGTLLADAAPGLDYNLSVSLNGSSLWTENDSLSMALRYAGNKDSNMYMADATLRYPINDKLRIGPRVRLSYRDGETSDQYTFMPAFTLNYRVNKQWSLDSQLGARWQDNVTAAGDNQSLDILANVGYRFEF